MENIIEIKNLGKKYRLGQIGMSYVALRDVLTNIFKNPFRFTKDKITGVVGKEKEDDKEFWALKNVNLEIKKGEAIGIIGSNGAGKSTLLKILSKITLPTTGEIRMMGRVTSLLEVGTGFHPELTGRENIYLNGAILGMPKEEIKKKFDSIVEFAGVKKFIDTPVKRYSSGMYVRLAFSIASHMEPDILIIDEVLAVGDSDFRRKSLKRMSEVTRTAGRTVIFVSHNMSAVQRLCKRCVWLEKGQIKEIGEPKEIIEKYLNSGTDKTSIQEFKKDPNKKVNIGKVTFLDKVNTPATCFDINEPFSVKVEYEISEDLGEGNFVALNFSDIIGNIFLQTGDIDDNPESYKKRKAGKYVSTFNFPANVFNKQSCKISVLAGIVPKMNPEKNKEVYYDSKEELFIDFFNSGNFVSNFFNDKRPGNFLSKINSTIDKLNG